MKYQPGFTDFFMSPVTGRIILSMFPDLFQNYVWIGDRNDRPLPSPIIIDLRLEIIDLRRRLSETRFILQAPSQDFDSSQALNELIPGMLRHDAGIVSIQHLTYNKIWVGNVDNYPEESDALSGIEIEIGDINITIDSILDHLLEIDIEIGDINISLESIIEEIGTILTLPYQNVFIGDIDNVPTPFPRIFMNNLPTMLSDDVDLLDGAYNLYSGSPDPLILGQPKIVKTLNITNMADLTVGHLHIGTNSTDPLNFGANRPVEIVVLPLDNMADLAYKKIWRGDIDDRPVAVTDLSDLEDRVTTTEGSITSILSDIASILSSIATISSSISSILSTIATLTADITVIDTTLLDLQSQIDTLVATTVDLQSQIDTNVASGLDHLADLQLQIDDAIASGNDHLATINTTLDYLQSEIDTINTSISSITSDISTINSEITTINTTLTTIEGNITTLFSDITSINTSISTINSTLTTLSSSITTIEGDITNITTVLLPAVYTYIDDAITNITNNFIAGGVLDMNDNRIINLPCDPDEDDDAISFCFFWHSFHDEVTVSWS